jgi:hypothetical protein
VLLRLSRNTFITSAVSAAEMLNCTTSSPSSSASRGFGKNGQLVLPETIPNQQGSGRSVLPFPNNHRTRGGLMFQRFRDLPDDSITQDVRGATVYGLNDDKLGKVDDIIFDPDSNEAGYAVIDSGGWLTSRKFLVPVEKLQSFRDSDRDFLLATDRDQLKALPEFDDSILDDDTRFRSYRERWRESWSRPTGTELRHPRLAAIEDRFRNPRRRVVEEPTVRSTRVLDSVTPIDRPIDNRPLDAARYSDRSLADNRIVNASNVSNVAVYGVFHDEAKVREAVESLKTEGFSDSDISVVFPDRGDTEKFAVEHNTKAPEGAAAGGVTGVLAGGVLGWLAGVGIIAIPGIGPLLAAGPIVAALAGAGAVGAAGGIVGALVGLGVPELEAKKYQDELKAGRILVAVQCSDIRFTRSAKAVLDKLGAKEVFTSGQERAA